MSLDAAVAARLASWEADRLVARIWDGDVTVWGDADTAEIADRLGWLHLPDSMPAEVPRWRSIAEAAADRTTVVLLGMGGSSLAPEVFSAVFGNGTRNGHGLRVLDTTHPETIAALTAELDPATTLFVVSSKSGGTLETLSLFRHFHAWLSEQGVDDPGDSFVAITDPGSGLADLAAERSFRATALAPADVGGRYSALCDFGLLPATLIGLDPTGLLDSARGMAQACRRPSADNPGLHLGAVLGEAALAGRDKLTFLTSPSLAAFPMWLEQLVAESLGKDGTGIVPVADEPIRPHYGGDRVFVAYRLAADPPIEGLDAIEAAGHPVVRITVDDPADLGAEMFRAEFATAVAAVALGVHPFDQPDVEAAKHQARQLLDDVGEADPVVPFDDTAIDDVLAALAPGGYVAVQAYVDQAVSGGRLTMVVDAVRSAVAASGGAPVTVGIGPRFLHSTGQLHKGGSENMVALQLLDIPHLDVPIPETSLSFGRVIRAQADGDAAVLQARGRTVVRRLI